MFSGDWTDILNNLLVTPIYDRRPLKMNEKKMQLTSAILRRFSAIVIVNITAKHGFRR